MVNILQKQVATAYTVMVATTRSRIAAEHGSFNRVC